MKKITPKRAHEIAKEKGVDIDDDQVTFYATDDDESEVYPFDTKKERDDFVNKERRQNG